MPQQIKKLDSRGLSRLQALEKDLGCCVIALERPPQPAVLSEAQLKKLQSAEKEMDTVLVAYNC